MSRSYTNLLDLASGNFPTASIGGGGLQRMSRVMTTPGTLTELDDDDGDEISNVSDQPSSSCPSLDRVIVVANQLPIIAQRSEEDRLWSFSWDEQSLLYQLKDGIPKENDSAVLYVGSLRGVEIPVGEQDDVASLLLDRFNCVPTFLDPELNEKFYHGFCKSHLWPLLHYMLPNSINRFDRSLWEAYVNANRIFSQKVIEVLSPEDDYVWIHDYHLLALPSFLRRRFVNLRMGFFLHSPFPTSEIFRGLPVREEILKSLLNCDLIGFHIFDYARHFLSCCSRMLGLDYQSRRGYIGLEYFGRTIGIKILPVGVHMAQFRSCFSLPSHSSRVTDLRREFDGRTVLLGVDDMDIFKGIDLKLLAFEQLLKIHQEWRQRAVLVQIVNPARGRGPEIDELQLEIHDICDRINREFGGIDYKPVVFIERPLPFDERIAYYVIAECLVVTAVRDGMNLTPYEYIVCREGVTGPEPCPGGYANCESVLVVSEFIGCSPSLSGAIRVNPWNTDATGEAMCEAISMPSVEKQLRHQKHFKYVSSHDVAYWSRSFIHDLERTCGDHFRRRCWGTGLGFGFRVVALDPNFRKLDLNAIIDAYKRAKNRVIFLDSDGALKPRNSTSNKPDQYIISLLNTLSMAEKNKVCIISGRGRNILDQWFAPCKGLCLAAEHGYFLRWGQGEDDRWSSRDALSDLSWMEIAKPVMSHYTDATDGSCIETKETALVWHHQDADPGFGSAQAKELLDHLEGVLTNEPVVVKRGEFIVEVKPQGISKGTATEKILLRMKNDGYGTDFVLCIGDDGSDDMFQIINNAEDARLVSHGTSVFACTVGQKSSKARYYLDDSSEVVALLEVLADASGSLPSATEEIP